MYAVRRPPPTCHHHYQCDCILRHVLRAHRLRVILPWGGCGSSPRPPSPSVSDNNNNTDDNNFFSSCPQTLYHIDHVVLLMHRSRHLIGPPPTAGIVLFSNFAKTWRLGRMMPVPPLCPGGVIVQVVVSILPAGPQSQSWLPAKAGLVVGMQEQHAGSLILALPWSPQCCRRGNRPPPRRTTTSYFCMKFLSS